MSKKTPNNLVERVSGNVFTESALTLFAAGSGVVLAPLLPILAKSIASERQKKRVDEALCKLTAKLEIHEELLKNITDSQYQLMNEVLSTLMQTVNDKKIALLLNAVENSLKNTELSDQESVFLSRIIRDISVDEIVFLKSYFQYHRVWLNETQLPENENKTLQITPESRDGQTALGLVTLGLLMQAEPTYDESGLLRFSPMVAKLIAVLKTPE